jgi:hypothetical protein
MGFSTEYTQAPITALVCTEVQPLLSVILSASICVHLRLKIFASIRVHSRLVFVSVCLIETLDDFDKSFFHSGLGEVAGADTAF